MTKRRKQREQRKKNQGREEEIGNFSLCVAGHCLEEIGGYVSVMG